MNGLLALLLYVRVPNKTHSSGNGGVLLSDGHQVTQQILGLEEAEPHVRGPSPLLEHGRVEVVLGRRSVVEDRNGDLATLQGHDLRVLRGANDGVVPGDGRVAAYTEVGLAVVVRVGKVLPGRPGLTKVLGLFQNPETRPG